MKNVDDPQAPDRLIRLKPRDAVVWAYATSHVNPHPQGADLARAYMMSLRVPNGWVCGPFWAEEQPVHD